jgi:uncharacterized protein YcnI
MRTRASALLKAAAATAAATVAAVVFTPGVASAHVTVSSANATQGGYAKVTFRVPNEKATAGTAKVEITLPPDRPVASVSIKPTTGWTATLERTTLPTPIKNHDTEISEVVSKITWTAAADAVIQPGQFQEFDVSLGPLPEADQLVFKALQTYSDGEVVRWIEEPTGGAEAEHPAPVLKLAKAAEGDDAHDGADTTEPAAAADDGGSDGLTRTFAIVGLVIAVAGLALGLLAYRKASSRPIG